MAGDKVIMPKSSMLMIHNAWTCAAGNAKELRKVADDLDKMSETISQAYLEKSDGKITPEELKEKLDAETYMSAEECMKYGLCDSFGDEESAEDKVKAAVQNSKKTAFMKAQVMNMFTPDVKKILNTEDEGTCSKNAQTEAPETDVEETAAPEEETAETKEEAHTESVADTFMKLFINRKAV